MWNFHLCQMHFESLQKKTLTKKKKSPKSRNLKTAEVQTDHSLTHLISQTKNTGTFLETSFPWGRGILKIS